MATVTLEYDGRNPIAKKTMDYILSLGVFKKKEVSKIEKSPYNPKFVKKIKNAEKGKSYIIEDVDEFMASLV